MYSLYCQSYVLRYYQTRPLFDLQKKYLHNDMKYRTDAVKLIQNNLISLQLIKKYTTLYKIITFFLSALSVNARNTELSNLNIRLPNDFNN